jgi:hypothetical protein
VTAIYISGSTKETTTRARPIRDLLRSEGITVVGGGWIESVERHGSLGIGLPAQARERIADEWVADIRRARVLLALVPDDHVSAGLVAEVSIARTLGLPVVLASKTPREKLHPWALFAGDDHVFSEDVAAAAAAVKRARRR